MTFCASLCWKSLSQPFLCNLDSTPPQVMNAAANDGEPCSGGQSPSSQDSVPIHGGVPEFSGSVRDRPDFTLLQKSEGRPQFLFRLFSKLAKNKNKNRELAACRPFLTIWGQVLFLVDLPKTKNWVRFLAQK